MLNQLDVYRDAGRKVGRATNHDDGFARQFHADHFSRMRALEAPADRPAATQAYEDGYREARRLPAATLA
jgi:hypothetical protein